MHILCCVGRHFVKFYAMLIRLLPPLPLRKPRPRSPYLSRLLLFLHPLTQRFPQLGASYGDCRSFAVAVSGVLYEKADTLWPTSHRICSHGKLP